MAAVLCVYFLILKKTSIPYDYLYKYQINKIKISQNVATVFIGDSSLGNCIDGDYFSSITNSNSINLALTGMYGYAGSYNMLKKAISHNPLLKNVVIMQTIDMQARPISFKGYAFTMSSYFDFKELSVEYKLKSLMAFADVRDPIFIFFRNLFSIQKNNNDLLKNDYIKQGAKKDFSNSENCFYPNQINSESNYFLIKIKKLCEDKGLNLIYIYGPLYARTVDCSQEYIKASNKSIQSTGVLLIDEIKSVNNCDLGDSQDHILPEKKHLYTKIYADILLPYLK